MLLGRHPALSLKRFRSFGSLSSSWPLRPTSTPSPLHFATKPRRGGSGLSDGSPLRPRVAWEADATIDLTERALGPSPLRPPPIHTSLSMQSLDEWDAIEAAVPEMSGAPPSSGPPPPAVTAALDAPIAPHRVAPRPLVVSSSAWRPPPILRPASPEAEDVAEAEPVALQPVPPLVPPFRRPPSLWAIDIEGPPSPHCPHLSLPPPPPTPTTRDARNNVFARDRPAVEAMSLVAPSLFVGNEDAAADEKALAAAGVTHILNCTNRPNALAARGAATSEPAATSSRLSSRLTFFELGLLDNSSDLPRMQEAMHKGSDFIANALDRGGSVLVHCRAGISRSATLAIAHLVRSSRQPVDQILESMRARRPAIDPNLGYMLSLYEWEKQVLSMPEHPETLRGHVGSPRALSPPRVRPLSRVG